ncbi:uncharacterized protein BJ171DRAFT_500167 [Polychytrium aggregatum]|uniref:uncharacterized protein n=1 Tax=Polychytrium aggregatum TaxID=110093 RepID=UPI0022FEEF41|nr:uncharacterized protein BJ171DRAFT_500167 [Polychytrium aggregatum]KAI9205948.1 hypothetical protein BJ171DRAFT_500167 [Polychytrium aggregatum]
MDVCCHRRPSDPLTYWFLCDIRQMKTILEIGSAPSSGYGSPGLPGVSGLPGSLAQQYDEPLGCLPPPMCQDADLQKCILRLTPFGTIDHILPSSFLGYGLDEIVNQSAMKFVHRRDVHKFCRGLDTMFKGGYCRFTMRWLLGSHGPVDSGYGSEFLLCECLESRSMHSGSFSDGSCTPSPNGPGSRSILPADESTGSAQERAARNSKCPSSHCGTAPDGLTVNCSLVDGTVLVRADAAHEDDCSSSCFSHSDHIPVPYPSSTSTSAQQYHPHALRRRRPYRWVEVSAVLSRAGPLCVLTEMDAWRAEQEEASLDNADDVDDGDGVDDDDDINDADHAEDAEDADDVDDAIDRIGDLESDEDIDSNGDMDTIEDTDSADEMDSSYPFDDVGGPTSIPTQEQQPCNPATPSPSPNPNGNSLGCRPVASSCQMIGSPSQPETQCQEACVHCGAAPDRTATSTLRLPLDFLREQCRSIHAAASEQLGLGLSHPRVVALVDDAEKLVSAGLQYLERYYVFCRSCLRWAFLGRISELLRMQGSSTADAPRTRVWLSPQRLLPASESITRRAYSAMVSPVAN